MNFHYPSLHSKMVCLSVFITSFIHISVEFPFDELMIQLHSSGFIFYDLLFLISFFLKKRERERETGRNFQRHQSLIVTASTAKCGDGFSSWFTRQRAVECGRNEQNGRKKRNDRAPLQIAIEHLIYSPRELRWFFSGCQDCPSGIVRADQWISKRQPPPNPRTKYNKK